MPKVILELILLAAFLSLHFHYYLDVADILLHFFWYLRQIIYRYIEEVG